MSTKKMIMLRGSDGQSFEVEEEIAVQSRTIAHMVEDNCASTEIYLANVTSKTLALVMEYCKTHHVDEAKPIPEEELKKWDEKFMEKDHYTIIDLTLAAAYLKIKDLHDLACLTLVQMLDDMTEGQICELFNIPYLGFYSEEEEEIRRESQWAIQ